MAKSTTSTMPIQLGNIKISGSGSTSGNASTNASPAGPTLHTGAPSGTGTQSTTGTPPSTPNATTTNGGFLDFLVAIAALVMMINAHKFARQFLDYLIPGGGGGRGIGSLMSGILEGAGMELGWSAMRKGGQVIKAAGGMAAAGGVGGIAAAMKYSKETGLLGKDGIVGGMFSKAKSAGGALGLYPPSLPGGKETPKLPPDPTQFTMRDPDAPGGTGSMGSMGGSSGGGLGMSFGPQMSTSSRVSSGTGGLFDGGSTRYGAATQMKPSAQGKFSELNKHKQEGTVGGAVKAGLGGAWNRLKSDAKHKATGGRGYAPTTEGGRSANNLLGVMTQEWGDIKAHENRDQLNRESFVPGKHLMDAVDKGDGFAQADMEKIGSHQATMEQGMQEYEQGHLLKQTLQTDYDAAESNLHDANYEMTSLEVMKDKLEAQGMSGTQEYQDVSSRYTAASARHSAAETSFDRIKKQMAGAENRMREGETRVRSSQNAINNINMGWTPEHKRNSAQMLQAAQAHANRPSLSGLGQAPNYYSQREKKRPM